MSLSQAHPVKGNSRYNKVKGDKVNYSLLSPFTFIKKVKQIIIILLQDNFPAFGGQEKFGNMKNTPTFVV